MTIPFTPLALALGLGLLVGLQREYVHNPLAGIRTFALITLLGALSGLLAEHYGVGLTLVALIAVMGFGITGNLARLQEAQTDPGLTTEMAMLIMFAVGLALAAELIGVAILTTGVATVLLHFKTPLHSFVKRLGETDVRAGARLVLIALVILPVLPNRAFGPYGVLNPFQVWLMVVLIVGVSLVAYIAARLVGPTAGTLLTGLLGGLISSTATTVSYAQRSSKNETSAALGMIMIASTVAFGRVVAEIAVVSPKSLASIAPPLLFTMLFMALLTTLSLVFSQRKIQNTAPGEAPSNLSTAVTFGLLYGLILLAIAWAEDQLGQGGVYLIAALSGLTDIDAITLSTAQLVNNNTLNTSTAWRIIMVAALSNLSLKGLVVLALAKRALAARVGLLFLLTIAAGSVLLYTWPA